MSLAQTPSASASYTAWPRIALTAGLLLASILTVVNCVQLSRLPTRAQFDKQVMAVQALTARTHALEQHVDALSRLPKPVTRSDVDSVRRTLEKRLSRVEQLQATDARSDVVQTLQARVDRIEARLKKSFRRHALSPHLAKAKRPQNSQPPFDVIDVELRGGERFLTVMPLGATSLAQVQLLRDGESADGWQLRTIGAHRVVFRVKDRLRHIALP